MSDTLPLKDSYMNGVSWKQIPKKLYMDILCQLEKAYNPLIVHATRESEDDDLQATIWGFEGADYPLLMVLHTREDRTQEEWKHKHFIAVCTFPEGDS